MKNTFSFMSMTIFWACFNLNAMASTSNSKVPSLLDFNVYVSGDYDYSKSDIEGKLGVGGNAKIKTFELNKRGDPKALGLSVGGNLTFSEGTVYGDVEAGGSIIFNKTAVKGSARAEENLELDGTSLDGNPEFGNSFSSHTSKYDGVNGALIETYNKSDMTPHLQVDHQAITRELVGISKAYSEMEVSDRIEKKSGAMTISATHNISVVTIDEAALSGKKTINIEAHGAEKLIINVKGEHINIVELEVNVSGIKPKQIFWNLAEASSVNISNSIDKNYGIPGSILAPNADVNFNEGLVTGGIYCKSLKGGESKNGGQVNAG